MTMASSPAGAAEGLSGERLDLSGVRTIEGVDVRGKRVLVRVDFNVPIENGVVADATRLERVLPTIARLAKAGAKVIVLSHLGRPKGVVSPDTSLWPVAEKMRELMPGTTIHFIGDCFGEEARRGVAAVKPGEVAVLENLRYYSGEEKNDLEFAKALADLGDIYVNDAFSSAHRAHASIEALAHLRPAYAGHQLMAEVDALGKALENPARPVMAIVGGAKVSTKIEVLTHLVTRMDQLAVGGGMANTFLAAKGIDTGASLVEPEFIETAKDILARAGQERLRDRASDRRRRGEGVQARRRLAGLPGRASPRRRHDPRFRTKERRRPEATPCRREDRLVERSARRVRDGAVRRGDFRARPRGGPPHEGGQARERCRWRRYGQGAEHRRRR